MLLNCGAGKDSWESLGQQDQTSQSLRKSILNIHWRYLCWSWSSNTLAGPNSRLIGQDPDAGKDWGQNKKGVAEDEMVRYHYWLVEHESKQTLASQIVLVVNNLLANARDVRDVNSMPGLGRSPGGGRGSPLQYSCLENPMDRGAWRASVHRVIAQNQTRLKWYKTHVGRQ